MPRRVWILWLWAGLFACSSREVRLDRAPIAFAGFDRFAAIGEHVPLDASGSMDPDGDGLSYEWRLEARPAASAAGIAVLDAKVTEIVPDVAGTFVASLTVSDGRLRDRSLVSVFASAAPGAADLRLALSPATCNADFERVSMSPCGAPEERIAIQASPSIAGSDAGLPPDARIDWTFLRLPPGAVPEQLAMETGVHGFDRMTFVAPRPGEYWISARLFAEGAASPPAVGSVAVFAAPPAASGRPVARIDATPLVRRRDRLLLDSRASVVGTAAVSRTWGIALDPSEGIDRLSDSMTGCAPEDGCRLLFPSSTGVYIVTLAIEESGVAGATALFAAEVH